jgi:uncharacterized protein
MKRVKISQDGYNGSDLAIKKSRNGFGIFAKRNFKKGEKIFQVTGTFIGCNEDDNLDETTRDNTYRFDKVKYISPTGTIGDYLNHSCEPNARMEKIRNKLCITAFREISKDDEVFIDYSTTIAKDDVWQMKCNCGSKNCRGTIKKFTSLPKKVFNHYVANGIIPEYILNI